MKRTAPPVRIMGGKAGRNVLFLGNPWLDYAGVWTERDGRMMVFEAKSTSGDRLPFLSDSGLTERQMEAGHHWDAAGAVVFLLWQSPGQVRLIPWKHITFAARAWNMTPKRGTKSFNLDAGRPVPQGKGYRLVDFLAVVRELWIL